MSEYYTNSVNVSGRPNYTECNLDFFFFFKPVPLLSLGVQSDLLLFV